MAAVKVYYDTAGETLTVWFGDPRTSHICEEAGDDVVLMKDKAGTVIGFEKLNFAPIRDGLPDIQLEAVIGS